MLRIGIDIGGTKIKIGILDGESSAIIIKGRIPFSHKGYQEVVRETAMTLEDMIKEIGSNREDIGSIGMAVPGSIDNEKGLVVHAHNLDFHNVPIVAEMKKYFPEVPVYIANDANAAAMGELCCGSFRNYKTAVILTLGTGVGGGIICNGKMFNGGRDNGVELGHMMLKYGGIKCSCGNLGCVESYCSVSWLINQGRKVIEESKESLIVSKTGGDPEKVDGKIMADSAREGDPVAEEIFETYIDNLSAALTSINALLDPEIIAIGGGISGAGDILFKPLMEKVKEKSFFKIAYNIVPALLGNDAGTVGAAMLFKNGG